MTALHSVAGIPEGSAGTEDLVNTVQILLDHGADLTFSTYQVCTMLLRIVTWNNCSLMWRAGPRYCWTSVPSLVEELRALNKRTAVKSAARGLPRTHY